jgi:hypothetical protein
MFSEEGSKGLRRPHCTVEEVSLFSLISFKKNFNGFFGEEIIYVLWSKIKKVTKGRHTATVSFPVSLLYLASTILFGS